MIKKKKRLDILFTVCNFFFKASFTVFHNYLTFPLRLLHSVNNSYYLNNNLNYNLVSAPGNPLVLSKFITASNQYNSKKLSFRKEYLQGLLKEFNKARNAMVSRASYILKAQWVFNYRLKCSAMNGVIHLILSLATRFRCLSLTDQIQSVQCLQVIALLIQRTQ